MTEHLQQIWPAIKATVIKSLNDNKVQFNKLEIDDAYSKNLKHLRQIMPHAEADVFPAHLFAHRFPNQTDEEYEYLKNNFRNITLPVWTDFINSINRAFNRTNYSIAYPKVWPSQFENDSIESYVEHDLPIHTSIHEFISSICIPSKLRDAMGLVVVKPETIPTIANGDDSVVDPDQMLEPSLYYIDSRNVLHYNQGKSALIISSDKSMVTYNGGKSKSGLVFEYYDQNCIVRIIQVGKRVDYKFEYEMLFQHDSGQMPAFQLKGIKKTIGESIMYESPFLHACDSLDTAIEDNANVQLSKVNMVYPFRIMYGEPCDFEQDGVQCYNGSIAVMDGEVPKNTTCPSCNGKGVKQMPKAGGTKTVEYDEDGPGLDIIKYSTPDTSGLSFLNESIKHHTAIARGLLHLDEANNQATPATATGKIIDQKSLHAFIRPISDSLFDLFDSVLEAITKQRYGNDVSVPKVNRPTEFDLKTSTDYLEEFRANVEAEMPMIIRYRSFVKYVETLFSSEDANANYNKLLMYADSLLLMSANEISIKVGRGAVKKWEEYLHDRGIYIIQSLIESDPNFFEKKLTAQRDALHLEAQSAVPESNTTIEDLVSEPAA